MAAYKALVSFSGQVSMTGGEVRVLSDPALIKDLLRAGYIEEVKPSKPAANRTRKKAAKTE